MRIALPPVLSQAAFADAAPDRPIVTLGGETMGTRWTVKFAQPSDIDPESIGTAIAARLDGLVGEMSHWAPQSILSQFNRAEAGAWVRLPDDFAQVIAAALDIAGKTNGAFDPAIGRIVDLWGFGPVSRAGPASPEELADALRVSGWQRLEFDAAGKRLRQPGGLSLDLSGIAKGYAADAVSGLLEAAGVIHHLVEIGGEFVGRGVRPDGDPWWVELENPVGAGMPPARLRIALHALAVATSGDYQRGRHTIDPRTGEPVANGIASVSVIGTTAMEADAWATVLTVLDLEDGVALATEAKVAARIIRRAGDAFMERLTPALQAMLED